MQLTGQFPEHSDFVNDVAEVARIKGVINSANNSRVRVLDIVPARWTEVTYQELTDAGWFNYD